MEEYNQFDLLKDHDDSENYHYKKEGWSEERIKKEIEELRQHPLFLQDIGKFDDNEELLALQSIIYDDEKENELDLAQLFYTQGNEIFKDRLMPILKIPDFDKLKETDKEKWISLRGSHSNITR